jgi:hypothetical protein
VTVHIASAVRTSRVTEIVTAIDAGASPGKLLIYGDTQPANADTAVTTQTLLLEFVLNDPCATVSGSTATFDVSPAITDDALDTDTATWGRFTDSDGNAVLDLAVTSGEITITDATLETGQTVTVASASITEPT